MKLATAALTFATSAMMSSWTVAQSVCDQIFGKRNCKGVDEIHENLGNPLDVPGRIIREGGVETLGPLLAEAIRHSRNDARGAGTRSIPPDIHRALSVHFNQNLLRRVQFRVGQGNDLSVQANAIRFGDAVAVALIDTIVFKSGGYVNDVALWAHELGHIMQYEKWGLGDFAKKYVRDYAAVEREADAISQDFLYAYQTMQYKGGTFAYVGECQLSNGYRAIIGSDNLLYDPANNSAVARRTPPEHPGCAYMIYGASGSRYCANFFNQLFFYPSGQPAGQCGWY